MQIRSQAAALLINSSERSQIYMIGFSMARPSARLYTYCACHTHEPTLHDLSLTQRSLEGRSKGAPSRARTISDPSSIALSAQASPQFFCLSRQQAECGKIDHYWDDAGQISEVQLSKSHHQQPDCELIRSDTLVSSESISSCRSMMNLQANKRQKVSLGEFHHDAIFAQADRALELVYTTQQSPRHRS